MSTVRFYIYIQHINFMANMGWENAEETKFYAENITLSLLESIQYTIRTEKGTCDTWQGKHNWFESIIKFGACIFVNLLYVNVWVSCLHTCLCTYAVPLEARRWGTKRGSSHMGVGSKPGPLRSPLTAASSWDLSGERKGGCATTPSFKSHFYEQIQIFVKAVLQENLVYIIYGGLQ